MWLVYVDVEGFRLLCHNAEVILLLIEFKDALFDCKIGISGGGVVCGAWWYECLVNG